jgi:hypothetical protein
MDGAGDSGVSDVCMQCGSARDNNGVCEYCRRFPIGSSPASDVGKSLLDAVNEQVVPQLNLLGRGPLALATLKALQAAVEHAQGVSATVLQLRVELDGRLYDVAVNVTVNP